MLEAIANAREGCIPRAFKRRVSQAVASKWHWTTKLAVGRPGDAENPEDSTGNNTNCQEHQEGLGMHGNQLCTGCWKKKPLQSSFKRVSRGIE
jgi:hypothetical protein